MLPDLRTASLSSLCVAADTCVMCQPPRMSVTHCWLCAWVYHCAWSFQCAFLFVFLCACLVFPYACVRLRVPSFSTATELTSVSPSGKGRKQIEIHISCVQFIADCSDTQIEVAQVLSASAMSLTAQSNALLMSKSLYDWRSASQYVLVSSPLWDLWPDITPVGRLLSKSCGLVSLRRPLWREDGSALCNHSIVRVAQNPQPYFTVSFETPATYLYTFLSLHTYDTDRVQQFICSW
jgi:hypothetical protein